MRFPSLSILLLPFAYLFAQSLSLPHDPPPVNNSHSTPDKSDTPATLREPDPEKRDAGAWTLQIEYAGDTFFDGWTFFNETDPSHGLVNYLDHDDAFTRGLAFFTANQTPGIQADSWTTLQPGQNRDSIRIQSNAIFNGGLFIIDVGLMPWGCGIWPSFWTLGYGVDWPTYGEIDIIEGIMDKTNNQMTIHSTPGCTLDTSAGLYTGSTGNTNCDSSSGGTGCGIVSSSAVSYGEQFNAQGGGVFAMQWDDSGIYFWDWPRNGIPQDITNDAPTPITWGEPTAFFSPTTCNIGEFFKDNQLVFTINLCGDWAGGNYGQFSYCPGTCASQIADPANLVNSIWLINYIRVYQYLSSSDAVMPTLITNATDIQMMATGKGGPVAINDSWSAGVEPSGAEPLLKRVGPGSVYGILGLVWVLRMLF